ncbi:MAG: hypothetical protein H6641_16115 [Caldilineaceae bacterium]|nr:hypothetical protein [Caldilineaceae bacterium]
MRTLQTNDTVIINQPQHPYHGSTGAIIAIRPQPNLPAHAPRNVTILLNLPYIQRVIIIETNLIKVTPTDP